MACVDDGIHLKTVEMEDPRIDTDKLSYEIFSILETKFLFGYDDRKLWIPKQIPDPTNGVVNVSAVEDCGIPATKNPRGKICVLSIDGGGMRSIIPGKALSYLETSLKKRSGNSDARIADYFDVAAGTGVGGIFTAMLFAANNQSRPIFHADDTWRFLAAEGEKLCRSAKARNPKTSFFKRVFRRPGGGGGGADGSGGLEKAMKAAFTDAKTGRRLTLKNTLKPVLIPCYDLSSAAPFLFSRADAMESDSFDFNLWEVCLATSAEPGVSDPVCMKSVDGSTCCIGVDGGLTMNNPTAAAMTHVLHNKQEFPMVRGVEDIMVLSLGAGGQLGFDYEQVKKWTVEDWAQPLARISGEGAAEMVDHAVALAFGPSRSSNYVRIQAHGSSLGRCGANVDSDPSPSNIKMMSEISDETLKQKNVESVLFGGKRIGEESNFEKLDWFAEQLVVEHQRRSFRKAPTVALKNVN